MKKIFIGTLGLLLLSGNVNAAQSSLGDDYLSFKNWLNKEYNLHKNNPLSRWHSLPIIL